MTLTVKHYRSTTIVQGRPRDERWEVSCNGEIVAQVYDAEIIAMLTAAAAMRVERVPEGLFALDLNGKAVRA